MRRRRAPGCEWDPARLAGRVRLPSGHDRYVGTCQVQRLCAAPPGGDPPPPRVPAVSGGWRCPRSPQPAPPAPREDVCVSVPSPARARLARLLPGDAFARGPLEKAASCGPWASAPPAPARASVGKPLFPPPARARGSVGNPLFPRQLGAPWGGCLPAEDGAGEPTLSGELFKGLAKR